MIGQCAFNIFTNMTFIAYTLPHFLIKIRNIKTIRIPRFSGYHSTVLKTYNFGTSAILLSFVKRKGFRVASILSVMIKRSIYWQKCDHRAFKEQFNIFCNYFSLFKGV